MRYGKWILGATFMMAIGLTLYVTAGGPDWSQVWTPLFMLAPIVFGLIMDKAGIVDAAKGHQALFFSELEKAPEPDGLKLCMQVTSNNEQETYNFLGQWPGMKEFLDERQVEAIKAGKFTIVNKTWESTIELSKDDFVYDRLGIINPWLQDSARVPGRHKEEMICALLNGGFTSDCYDGKKFFATDHPIDGGTNLNKTTKALDSTEYGKARAALRKIKGDKGKLLGVKGDLLVVAGNLEATALDIVKAEREATGKTQVWRDTAELLVLDGLTDGYWFLMDSSRALKPLILQKVPPVEITGVEGLIQWIKDEIEFMCSFSDSLFSRGKVQYGLEGRYNAGYGLYQMIYGSTGTT